MDESNIKIARWSDRFLAWLVDFVIIMVIFGAITSIITDSYDIMIEDYDIWIQIASTVPTSLTFFAYWSILEYKTNQSIGKKILRLKTIYKDGNKPDLKSILISSFGKSFLLPIDVILGLIFTNKNRQRIFNNISDTLVIKLDAEEHIYERD